MISPKICHCIRFKICQNLSLYPLSITWDTIYVTVSNTWAIKDTVTSYFTNYTLCIVLFEGTDCRENLVCTFGKLTPQIRKLEGAQIFVKGRGLKLKVFACLDLRALNVILDEDLIFLQK